MAVCLRVAAPIAAFMATKAAGGPDLHPERSEGPNAEDAEAGDFASRCKAPLGGAAENRRPQALPVRPG
jgi:hypothetical protein